MNARSDRREPVSACPRRHRVARQSTGLTLPKAVVPATNASRRALPQLGNLTRRGQQLSGQEIRVQKATTDCINKVGSGTIAKDPAQDQASLMYPMT